MVFCRTGDTYFVRFDVGEEILSGLKNLCGEEGIRLAQVDAIGASGHAVIGVYDLEKQVYHREELHGFMEITSLTGNVTEMDGQVYLHLHGTLADRDHRVHGGHLIELQVGATCEMFVRILPGKIIRKKDETLGINLAEPDE